MIKKYCSDLAIMSVLFLIGLHIESAEGFSGTPPNNRTGAPGHNSCAQCHTSTGGDGGVNLSFSGIGTYQESQTYSLMVTVQDPGQSRFGFSMVARDSDNNTQDVGTWSAGSANTQTHGTGSSHVGHLSAPTGVDTHTFTVNWTAPATGVGDVTFYIASVAANGNGSNGSGDFAYLTTLTISEPLPNQAPIVTVPAGTKNVTTGLPRSIAGITVSDPDSGSSDLTLTLAALNGVITIKDTVPGGVVAGDITNNNSGSVIVSGTLAELNATLADSTGLVYQSSSGHVGADTLNVTLNDNGNIGTGGALQDSVSIPIQVYPLPSLGSYTFLSASELQFTLTGTPGETVTIERSDDLNSWSFLAEVTPGGTTAAISDNSVSLVSGRFYRVVISTDP